MRVMIFALLVLCMVFACKKSSNPPVSTPLTGKWVLEPGDNSINDTLIFYSENDSTFFFDKSVYYQLNMAAWTTDNAFKYNYKIDMQSPDSIMANKMTSVPAAWVNVYLRQISPDEIEIGNFRHVNPPGEKYVYRKAE